MTWNALNKIEARKRAIVWGAIHIRSFRQFLKPFMMRLIYRPKRRHPHHKTNWHIQVVFSQLA